MRSSPYHPAGNGAVERENRSIKELIRSYTLNSKDEWDQFVPQIVYARNTSIHASTSDSPYEMVYGRKPSLIPQTPQEIQLCSEYVHKLDLIKRRIETEAVKRIKKGRRRRGEAFKEKKNYEFHVGDLVLITNEANHPSLSKKLEPKFIGPYRIERTVGTRNYMIKKVDGPYQKVVHHCRIGSNLIITNDNKLVYLSSSTTGLSLPLHSSQPKNGCKI